jgi:hypothetical protein
MSERGAFLYEGIPDARLRTQQLHFEETGKVTEPSYSRRDFVKRGAYVAPAILTLAAAPEFAKAGSVKSDDPKGGDKDKPGKDKPGKGWGRD